MRGTASGRPLEETNAYRQALIGKAHWPDRFLNRMMTDLAILLIGQASLWVFYALVPCWALGRQLTRNPWPIRLTLALLVGVVSHAVLGVVWGMGI